MPKLPRNVVLRGNTYYLKIMVKGKVYFRSLGRDLQQAKEKAVVMRGELMSQPAPTPSSPTLASFSARWLEEYVQQKRCEKAAGTAAQLMKDYTLPRLGKLQLTKVTYGDLRQFRAYLDSFRKNGKPLAVWTKKHILGDVRCLFRYALDLDLLTKSPWKSSLMPEQKKQAPKRLTNDQVTAILEATPDRYQFPVRLALLTGIRWGELQRLQWTHVQELPHPQLVLEETKSGQVRRIPLFPEAQELLKQEKAQSTGPYVCSWRARHAVNVVKGIVKKVGFHWHWHQLRHTFACSWLEQGGTLQGLQQMLGHSTPEMTQVYGALSDQSLYQEVSGITFGITNSCQGSESAVSSTAPPQSGRNSVGRVSASQAHWNQGS